MTIINSVIKGKQPVIDTLNVTPTTSAQQITAPTGTDGYSPVNVSAVTSSIDANIVAGNIKKDVQILGVTGSYEGAASVHYITFGIDNNGQLVSGLGATSVIDLTGCTTINTQYILNEAYKNNTIITGAVDMSGVQIMGSGRNVCSSMFYGCTGITSVNLSSLTTISSINGLSSAFERCTGITSVDLSSLTSLTTNSAMSNCFKECSGLVSVSFPSLTTITGSSVLGACFMSCTSLTSLSFYALDTNSFGSNTTQFNNMVQGVTGCTVRFPMRIQSTIGSWASVTDGFGGTNTTVLFDIVCTLTGADSNTYIRQQKDSTSTATAWTYNDTLYYTSGTAEPVVNGIIYSDAACTTAVTIISSIA